MRTKFYVAEVFELKEPVLFNCHLKLKLNA